MAARRRQGGRRALRLVAALALLGLVVAGAVAATSSSRRPSGALSPRPLRAALPPGTVAGFGGGAWSWFQDPRAVEVGGRFGRAYAGWIAENGDIKVGSFDPLLGRTRTHVVGHWIHDDHASPVLLVEPSRRLTVFWAVHNGRSVDYRTTLRPLDIRSWGPVRELSARLPGILGITYPNPVLVPAERDRLYMLWRGPDWGADYLTRTSSGHWSAARELIIPEPGGRPYVKVAGNGYDRIGLAFNDVHPGQENSSLYYVTVRRGALWTAGGRRIAALGSAPIHPSEGEKVYDGHAAGDPSWVWDVAFDSHQRPVIVYATFPSVHNHAYWYARFDGRRWVSHFLTRAGGSISPNTPELYYSGGLALNHSDPSVAYLSKRVGRWFRLERWATPDGGRTWHHTEVARRSGDQVRPVVPRGSGGGPISVMWMDGHYGAYIHYDTSIKFLTR